MPGLRCPAACLPLALALGLSLASPQATPALPFEVPIRSGTIPLSVDLEPARPGVGALISLRFVFPDSPGATLVSWRLGEGLAFEASSSRPFVSGSGERGTEVDLELRAEAAGILGVEELRFEDARGAVVVGAFPIEVTGPTKATTPPASWVWKAPERVWLYESFQVSLVGPGSIPAGAWPSFQLPEDLLLEPDQGDFSWIATALRPGSFALPAVEIRSATPAFAAQRNLLVTELPPSLLSSRAIGDFGLSLEGGERATVGSPYALRLLLSGEGNLPSILMPEPRLSLAGSVLPRTGWKARRVDSLAKSARGYRGSAILELSIVPTGTGTLVVSVPPLPYMARDGSIREARVRDLEVAVGEARASPPPLGSMRPPAARGSVDAPGPVALNAGRGSLVILARVDSLLAAGKKAEALATLFHQSRSSDRGLRKEARRLAAELGAEPPDLGSLPASSWFFTVSGLGLLGAAIPVLLSRRTRKGRRPDAGSTLRPAPLLLSVAALSLALGFLSFHEEGAVRYLTWSGRLYTIPSTSSELTIEMDPGKSGREMGSVPGWKGLVFRDGSSGWLPDDSLYPY